jgi:hypothetical protein
MMAIIPFFYLVALGFLFFSRRRAALLVLVVELITLAICIAMLIHHATDVLNLRL